MKRILFLASCILLLASSSSPALAAIQWSLSIVDGYYKPGLYELNYVLKHPEVELGPRNTEAKPSSYPVIYQGLSPRMPEMDSTAPRVGLQIQADMNPRYAVVFGGSMVTFDSTSRDKRDFFVGFNIPSTRETRFALSLNQFWLGGKRYWTFENKSDDREKKSVTGKSGEDGSKSKRPDPRVYAEMGLLAITRAYLTTDVWLHVYAPEEGFDFYKVTETGISGSGYATYIGVGGEYFLTKGVSIGMDIDYTIGGIGKLKFVHYFTVDPLEKDIIKNGDQVSYTDFRRGVMKPLFIDLEGWDLKGQVRFWF